MVERRGSFSRAGLLAVAAASLLLCVTPTARHIAQGLPGRVDDHEFWSMVSTFSEPGGFFRSDNLVSNETTFQHVIPAFVPSEESYAPARRALDSTRASLGRNGITDERHIDLWTAITTGLVSQQIANDPGGDRWTRLTDDVVEMFLEYCQTARTSKGRRKR